ncbi:MAG: hypothetical protein FWH14_00525 [Oscillospiraceae bacterium]|nr:hypothetical protein [Oscillospiraceae bacterium]
MADINLCYGTFFTVVSSFKKSNINFWQLHHRFMNVEYVPFGDEAGRFALTDDEFTENYKQKQTDSGNDYDSGNLNKFERINDFANCKDTKRLPIQKGAGVEHRFIGGFLDAAVRPKILRYVQTQIVAFLDEGKSVDIAKSIVELLKLSTVSSATEFFIDTNPASRATKKDISDIRTRFTLANLIAGVLYYIVKECTDNTVGKAAIDAWGKSPPNGSGVSRMIVLVEPDNFPGDEDIIENKTHGAYIDNRNAKIGHQKITNIGTVNGDININ